MADQHAYSLLPILLKSYMLSSKLPQSTALDSAPLAGRSVAV